jgi:hypothetical protein
MITQELRQELRAIVKEELYSIIFENREFETPMNAYIKSLIYNEVSNKKNKEKFEPTEYIFDHEEHNKIFNSFYIKSNVDFEHYYHILFLEKKIESSYEDFLCTMTDYNSDVKINWIDKSYLSKDFQYSSIFDFLNDITDTDFSNLNTYNRKKLIDYVCKKFLKGSRPLVNSNVETTFSTWSKKIKPNK